MGSDSGNSPQASSGLARSTSKLNLAKGFGLGRSPSSAGLAGMAGGASKLGLRRSPSRAQLIPSEQDSGPSKPGPDQQPPPQPQPRPDAKTSQAPAEPESRSQPITAAPSTSALPVLKRSHSMDHIDTVKAPVVSEGQKAVESITGKIALPKAPVPAMEGSMMPADMQDHEVSERGRVVRDRHPTEQGSGVGADAPPAAGASSVASSAGSSAVSPARSPTGAAAPPPASAPAPAPAPAGTAAATTEPKTAPTTSAGAEAGGSSSSSRSNSIDDGSQSRHAAASLTALGLLHRPGVPSPRDDAAALPEAEKRVDYFSHDWKESDIAGSWRYIISRRQDVANSARLENASWRMWAKAKNGLATVPPSTVNWLKDYDVTWLYGPLYHEPDNVYNGSEIPSRKSRHGSVSPGDDYRDHSPIETLPHVSKHGCYPKSILKKKTLAQLMVEEAHELEQNSNLPSQGRSTANYIRHHHYRPTPLGANRQMMADILNKQYSSMPSRAGPIETPAGSDPSLSSASGQDSEPGSRASTPGGTPSSRRPRSLRSMRSNRSGSLASLSTLERHVHFNDRVEQCVALDPEDNSEKSEAQRPQSLVPDNADNRADKDGEDDEDDEEEDDEDDDEDEEEDNAGLFLGLRRPSVIDTKAHENGYNIIASLPATTLKYDDEEEEEVETQRKEEVASSMLTSSRRPGFNAHYQPHPVQTQNGPSYQIVDPNIRPVDFQAKTTRSPESPTTTASSPSSSQPTKVRPAASFG